MMKVVAFNGSARKGGNTASLIKRVFKELESEGIETELVELAGKKLKGCRACFKCDQNQDKRCSVKNDDMNDLIGKMDEADGIILGSPVYFTNVTTEMKALIDRAGIVAKVNGDMLKRKVGAAVVAVRRAGAVHTFDSLNHFFQISEIYIVSSSYWNMGFGLDKGEVEDDEEGMGTMDVLGQNMAWLLKKVLD